MDDDVRLKRRADVARLTLQGYTMMQVAKALGCSDGTVHGDLVKVRAAWKEAAMADWLEAKAKELAALDEQERELWNAWRRSCGDEVTETRAVYKELRVFPADNTCEMVPVREEGRVTRKALPGDPRYMTAILAIRQFRCKLLGLVDAERKEKEREVVVIDWELVQAPVVDDAEQRIREVESRALVRA